MATDNTVTLIGNLTDAPELILIRHVAVMRSSLQERVTPSSAMG